MYSEFKKNGNVLEEYTGCDKVVTIPYGTSTIGSNAFVNLDVEEVTISKSVRLVKSGAFQNCKKLKKIILETIPEFEEDSIIGCPYLGKAIMSINDSNILKVNSPIVQFAMSRGNWFFGVKVSEFGSYIIGSQAQMQDLIPVDMRGVASMLKLIKKGVACRKKKTSGCIIVSEGDTITLYATLSDSVDIPYKKKLASLSRTGEFESVWTALSSTETEYVRSFLENVQVNIGGRVCEWQDFIVELSFGEPHVGVSYISEDTMFGSFERLYGKTAFFASTIV